MNGMLSIGGIMRALAALGYPQVRMISSTWANKPAATAVLPGQLLQVTDYGNKLFFSDGTIWRRMSNAPWDSSGTPAIVTNTLSETVLATTVIPPGAVQKNGFLRLSKFWDGTGSGNKTFQVKANGVQLFTSFYTTLQVEGQYLIFNQNAQNSQIALNGIPAGVGTSGGGFKTSAVDFTQAVTLTITGQLSTQTDSMKLMAYAWEILNP